jgi:hypothetical protein
LGRCVGDEVAAAPDTRIHIKNDHVMEYGVVEVRPVFG